MTDCNCTVLICRTLVILPSAMLKTVSLAASPQDTIEIAEK